MFTKVSVLVPTRQRVPRLRTLITSFDQTTGNGPDAELVFRVDEDDTPTRDFLLAWGGHRVVVGPRGAGYSDMPVFFNTLARVSTGDVFLCGNDDMVFKTPGWPALVLAAANGYPDGLFDFGVSTHNETHYPFSITSRVVANRLGFLWDPRIFWGDLFLRDVMASFGRSVMLPSVAIDHDWAGRAPDGVFLEAQEAKASIGAAYWTGPHACAVREAVDRLRGAAA